MRTLLLTCALFLGASSCATAKLPPAGASEKSKAPMGPVVKNGEAKLGDTTVCPVSGETFVVEADSPHLDYQGKTYFFCCNDCDGDFKKDPAKFIQAAAK